MVMTRPWAWNEVLQEAWPQWLWITAAYAVALSLLYSQFRGAGGGASHSRPGARVMRALALPSFGACLAMQVAATQVVRGRLLAIAPADPGMVAYFGSIDMRLGVLHACLLLVWSSCCLLGSWYAARRAGTNQAAGWSQWLLGACGWLIWITALLLLRSQWLHAAAFPGRSLRLTDSTALAESFQRLAARHVEVHWFICGAGLLPALGALMLIKRARLPPRATTSGLITSLVCLAIGVAAFVATRPLAADAAHPLPALEHHHLAGACTCGPHCDPAKLLTYPQIAMCDTPELPAYGPDLTIHEDGVVTFYGTEVGRNGTVDTAKLHAMLVTLIGRWAQSHAAEPFPKQLVVRAGATTPVQALLPALRVAANAGMRGALVCGAPTKLQADTQTLGALIRWQQCALPVRFAPEGAPLQERATLVEVTRAVEQGTGTFSLPAYPTQGAP